MRIRRVSERVPGRVATLRVYVEPPLVPRRAAGAARERLLQLVGFHLCENPRSTLIPHFHP